MKPLIMAILLMLVPALAGARDLRSELQRELATIAGDSYFQALVVEFYDLEPPASTILLDHMTELLATPQIVAYLSDQTLQRYSEAEIRALDGPISSFMEFGAALMQQTGLNGMSRMDGAAQRAFLTISHATLGAMNPDECGAAVTGVLSSVTMAKAEARAYERLPPDMLTRYFALLREAMLREISGRAPRAYGALSDVKRARITARVDVAVKRAVHGLPNAQEVINAVRRPTPGSSHLVCDFVRTYFDAVLNIAEPDGTLAVLKVVADMHQPQRTAR